MPKVMHDEYGKPFVVVRFTHSLSGERIAGLTQQVASRNERGRYVEEINPYDNQNFRCGQISGYPYLHTRIIPSMELQDLRLADTYEEVVVTSHTWGTVGFPVGFGPSHVVEAVQRFAAELLAAVEEAIASATYPEYVRSPENLNNW